MVDTACIIQARLTSSRLPGKIALDLCGMPLMVRVVEQCQAAEEQMDIIIATSNDHTDNVTENIANEYGIAVFRGPLSNVRQRYLLAGKGYKYLIRVTADNPFTEPMFIKKVFKILHTNQVDYVYVPNAPVGSTPAGMTYDLLYNCSKDYNHPDDREHVLLEDTIWNNPNIISKAVIPKKAFQRPDVRLTVDYIEDYYRAYLITNYLLKKGLSIGLTDIIHCYDELFPTHKGKSE